jgi:hypothetical protein
VRAGQRLLRAFGLLWVLALLALPLAVTWGLGTARTTDYLGPHRSTFTVTYDAQVLVDLGPFGDARLPRHLGPLGLDVHVGGLGAPDGSSALDGNEVLAAYASLYADPEGAVRGVGEQLAVSAGIKAAVAEVVLVALGGLWRLRGGFLTPTALRQTGTRRGLLAYGTVVVLVVGSCLAPPVRGGELRYPVTVADGTQVAGLTVDNPILADLLNRGISGAQLLADRQLAEVDAYVSTATANLAAQRDRWPAPRTGESMLFGFSDLHCSQAMTRIYTTLVRATRPALVFSSGDDTINGSAVERSCITREVAMSHDIPGPDGALRTVPFVDSTGNHDSDITNAQLARAGATVLDGQVVQIPTAAGAVGFLGDDDPELQIPFSINRTQQRPETEAQMGDRLLGVARSRPADQRVGVLSVHQPRAAQPIVDAEDPPVDLLTWGHLHAEIGPQVKWHADGSWTVALQMGTAGGITQQTLTALSTPITPPRIRADCYFFFRDDATGLVTGVQPIRFAVDGAVTVEDRIVTGDLAALPPLTRARLGDSAATAGPSSASPTG